MDLTSMNGGIKAGYFTHLAPLHAVDFKRFVCTVWGVQTCTAWRGW